VDDNDDCKGNEDDDELFTVDDDDEGLITVPPS